MTLRKKLIRLAYTQPPLREHLLPLLKKARSRDIEIGYGTYNVLQRYWWGQGDPLYAVLSRRGNFVDWITVSASDAEIDRLVESAQEAMASDNRMEQRVGDLFLKSLKKQGVRF